MEQVEATRQGELATNSIVQSWVPASGGGSAGSGGGKQKEGGGGGGGGGGGDQNYGGADWSDFASSFGS